MSLEESQVVSAPSESKIRDAFLSLGLTLKREGRLEKAADAFSEAAALDTTSPTAHLALGVVLNELRRFSDAENALLEALERTFTKDREALYAIHSNVGIARYGEERFQAARESFQMALEHSDNQADMYVWIGECSAALGDYQDALEAFDRALALNPTSEKAQLEKGKALLSLNRVDEAISLIDELLKNDPQNIRVLMAQGEAYFLNRKYEEALKAYQTVLDLDPANARALDRKVETLAYGLKRFQEALTILDETLEKHPNSISVIFEKAQILAVLGDFESSLSLLNNNLELAPDLAAAQLLKGQVLYQLGRYEEAVTTLDEGSETADDVTPFLMVKADALRKMGDYRESLAILERIRAIDSDAMPALRKMNQILQHYRHYDEALPVCDQILERLPNDAGALANKAHALDQLGRYDEALDLYNRALELNPAIGWVAAGKAKVLKQLNRYDEALAALDDISLDNTANTNWALSQRVDIYRSLGFYDRAMEQVNILIDRDPSVSWSRYMRALMSSLRGDPDQAHTDLEAAIGLAEEEFRRDSANSMVLFNKALYTLSLGKLDESIRLYEQGLTLKPSRFVMNEALDDLAQDSMIPSEHREIVKDLLKGDVFATAGAEE
ncbi:MAG TPA: tetratricopeptide repeat protein [Pyrinomonadaceae bacterium]